MENIFSALKKMVGKNKDANSKFPEKESRESAEKRAREAIDLLVHSPTQIPHVSYYGREGAQFNYSTMSGKPPTILRLQINEETKQGASLMYTWQVVSDDDRGNHFLFNIIADPGNRDPRSTSLRILDFYTLAPSRELTTDTEVPLPFLWSEDKALSEGEEFNKRTCQKIDVMSGGLAETKHATVEVRNVLFSGDLVPQRI